MSIDYGARAVATISNAPGTVGTSFVATTGQGARFFNGAQQRRMRAYDTATGLAEMVDCTNRATDTFTVSRNADGAGAQNITASGWVLEDLEGLGPMYPLPYDAGFWLPQGGGTWLPANPAGILRHAAHREGFMLDYEVVATAILAGTVNSIRVLLPTVNNLAPSGAKARGGGWPAKIFEGSVGKPAYVFWAASSTYVEVFKDDGTAIAAGTVVISFQARIEVI